MAGPLREVTSPMSPTSRSASIAGMPQRVAGAGSAPDRDTETRQATRRDVLAYATAGLGIAGACAAAWPFIASMNPAADVVALATTEVDLTPIAEGQSITVLWRGKPVFVRRRPEREIAAAWRDDGVDLPHPETDSARAPQAEWLIVIGICSHLGCVPRGQRAGDPRGEFGGWFCPCHGSHFDTSGRIRKGPAPRNLEVPPHRFLDDGHLLIG